METLASVRAARSGEAALFGLSWPDECTPLATSSSSSARFSGRRAALMEQQVFGAEARDWLGESGAEMATCASCWPGESVASGASKSSKPARSHTKAAQ